MNLPVPRLSQFAVDTVLRRADRIRPFVRVESTVLTTACRQAGLPMELAELCAGLLASVVDDLVTASRLARSDFERTKRMVRVAKAAEEPAAMALRLAIAASPINGEAAVRHWDTLCEQGEVGKLAWLLGMRTETAYKYSKKVEKRA